MASYETKTVGAGGTFDAQLGDGDSLENVLIDITADGASYSIHTYGTNWTIRNVGIRGTYPSGSGTPFTVRDLDPNGESVIENVYLGDGASDSFQRNTDQVTGIYFHRDHAGDCLVKNVYINEFRDNSVYASDPGHPEWEDAPNDPSGYGTVRIEDSYARNGGWNFRISTPGSYCKNCTSIITNSYKTGTPACYKDYFSRGLEFIDCHASMQTDGEGWTNGDGVWDQYQESQPIVFTGDCRYDGPDPVVGGYNAGDWTGSFPSSGARTTAPAGCPTSAEEAASGGGSDGGGGNGGTDPQAPVACLREIIN